MEPEARANAIEQINAYLLDLQVEGSFWIVVTAEGSLQAAPSLEDVLGLIGQDTFMNQVLMKFVTNEIWQ